MAESKLKSVPWSSLSAAEKAAYCDWLWCEEIGTVRGVDYLRVNCAWCRVTIMPFVKRNEWMHFFWAEEREHLVSDIHVQNVVLQKLGT